MRRAYDENTAPPAPRRPARRPGAVAGTMTVVIEGSELPGRTCRPEPDGHGHENVHVALGGRSTDRPALTMSNNPGMAIEPVPGDAPAARWEMPVTVRRDDDGFDFAGPFVRGVRDDRHLGLIWGDLQGDGTLQVFRGVKLRLVDVDPGLIEQAIRPGHKLVARIRLTDAKGNPICARVHPPYLTWSADGTVTGWMTTGPRVGSSSVAWETPGGVITSMAFGTVSGSTVQIGAVPPGAHTPNVKPPGVAVKLRAWSVPNPSCPVSTTLKPQPEPGVPNCASGRAIVMVRSACSASTDAVPTLLPPAFTQTGAAKPCTSTRWLQAPAGAMA